MNPFQNQDRSQRATKKASKISASRVAPLTKEMLAIKSKTILRIATAMVALAVLGGAANSAQDKYSLKVPGGLAFSEFRGYEDWAVVAVHQTEDLLKVVVANPVTMDAYRIGVPGNGKPFPDGSKMAKIEWKPRKSPTAPYDIRVPDAVYDVYLMVK